jgi:iron-sulfur cluster repair protein YtfE (RIC family)
MIQHLSLAVLVRRDHEHLGSLFDGLGRTPDAGLFEYFCEVRQALEPHERAEEAVVYPAFRQHVPLSGAIAMVRLAEHVELDEILAALDEAEGKVTSFRDQLGELRRLYLLHEQAEDAEIVVPLLRHVHHSVMVELGERYEEARRSARSHPFPARRP